MCKARIIRSHERCMGWRDIVKLNHRVRCGHSILPVSYSCEVPDFKSKGSCKLGSRLVLFLPVAVSRLGPEPTFLAYHFFDRHKMNLSPLKADPGSGSPLGRF